MIFPAYAEVTQVSTVKSFYVIDEKISFMGTEDEGSVLVNVIVNDPNGKSKLLGGFSDPDGNFETIPQSVDNVFNKVGTYSATAFVDKIEDGISLVLEFDGNRVFEAPDFVLALQSIPDKTVEVEKTVTFTAILTDKTIEDAVFSLNNEPSGATIDSKSGKFIWTPTKSHGNIQDVHYNFDVIVNKGAQEDKERITITVKQAFVEQETTTTTEEPPTTTEEPPTTTEEPPQLAIPAPFVDEAKDPQSYVDRYENEEVYREWFDKTYPEYDSIYQAVGLDEPLKIPASFVDEAKDPQSYVDRYENEEVYREWFDKTYPEYDSIYQAVGLDEPSTPADDQPPDQEEKEEFGECGEGTDLVDGMCVIVENQNGGGCLIATAAYGSEMAPQIQVLREIRDNQLMNTDSGASFMTGFNQFYYSFSPYIADLERENPVFKEAVKIGITPLLSSLSLMSHAESESEIIGYGIRCDFDESWNVSSSTSNSNLQNQKIHQNLDQSKIEFITRCGRLSSFVQRCVNN